LDSNSLYGICIVSISPLRNKASDRSEMVTQLLFGECVEILKKKGHNWLYVKCVYDNYEGWLDPKQLQILESDKDLSKYLDCPNVALDILESAKASNKAIPITAGSSLPSFDGLTFKIGKQKFQYSGLSIDTSNDFSRHDILINMAKKYLHAPYLWGGRSPLGIDCSGLVQVLFKMIGIKMPRDAKDQVEIGTQVDFVTEVLSGDLAYFYNSEGKIHHVGLMLEQGRILHASGKVRIDPMDQQGIYNLEIHKYTHKLRIIKRVL